MSIWFKEYTLDELLQAANKNMANFLGIEFIELGHNFLKARMPVDTRTMTPVGILHGGASCVLAETLGSCASYLCVDPHKYNAVGIEINANHLKKLAKGYAVGIATPAHIGKSIHVWDIRIHNEQTEQLICVSRLTTKIVDKINTAAL